MENQTPRSANPEPQCPAAKKCGGCQQIGMPYDRQLAIKQTRLITLLGKFGHVSPILGMEKPYHYRCKVQAAFGRDKKGVISGVYQSSSHRIVPISSCLLEDENADRIIVSIRKLVTAFKLKVFDERTMTGILRHVLIRKGYYTGQIMVVLVTGSEMFPGRKEFVKALLEKHPEITTVVQNVNGRFTSLVLGDKTQTLYGPGYIEDTILDYSFRISPRSFYQVNPVMTQLLYGKALEFLALSGRERVIDAYCGTGTIGLLASKTAGEVIGVELNADAVADARWNARRNGVENIRFFTGDASAFMMDMAQEGETADAVIMDPPRAGSDVRFMRAAVSLGPKKIVYVSCGPDTLARDLGYFTSHGYKVRKIQPVDMFPHTSHVETVVLLTRS